MSAAQGLDVEECKDLLAFKDLEGWDVTCSSQISLPGQINALGQCDQMYWEMMIFGHLVVGIFDISECGGASTAKEGDTVRTLDDLAEDAGWRSHLDGVDIVMI